MNSNFDRNVCMLKDEFNKCINSVHMQKANKAGIKLSYNISDELKQNFFEIIDKVNFLLIEDKDNFYGYFLFQMERKIDFNISSATGVNFKDAKYVIYFNPIIFLELNINQMMTSIKHEIHHILYFHIIRAKELKKVYSSLAVNLAMDIVVNQYLDNLPYYSVTLNYVNNKYGLDLKPYNSFEYYAKNIQKEISQLDIDNKSGELLQNDHSIQSLNDSDRDKIISDFNVEKSHEIWERSDDIDDSTLMDFTQKYINGAKKGILPLYMENILDNLDILKGELPWNLYLKKIMGTVPSKLKKTPMRKNRRQPDRLDLRGTLRKYKAEIYVAFDISGSISNEEFKKAALEVLSIVRAYNDEITIIECDKEIKRVYKARKKQDIKERSACSGGTKFTPVFEYVNKTNCNFLIYFTDGKGEKEIEVPIGKYKVLWVISGRGEELSLEKSVGVVKRLKKVKIKEDIDLKDIKTDGYSMNNQAPII